MQPLRKQPDYGVNPYLNTPPTKLKRDLKNESDPKKKRQMRDALNAWRTTVPGPFRKTTGEDLMNKESATEDSDQMEGMSNQELARAVVGIAREALMQDTETYIRDAVYEANDRVLGLLGSLKDDDVLRRDNKLMKMSRNMAKTMDSLMNHLNANYHWD